jgi:hypothetical protein
MWVGEDCRVWLDETTREIEEERDLMEPGRLGPSPKGS